MNITKQHQIQITTTTTMAKFILTLFIIAIFAAIAQANGGISLSGVFTGSNSALKSCYDLISTDGFGTDGCWSTPIGSSWSPADPAQFNERVEATLAFTPVDGGECKRDELIAAAGPTLATACPGVALAFKPHSSASSVGAMGAAAVAAIVAVAAVVM